MSEVVPDLTAETIAKLAALGVATALCPECTKVRETDGGVLISHSLGDKECPGAGINPSEPPAELRFEDETYASEVVGPYSAEVYVRAGITAIAHLEHLEEDLEAAYEAVIAQYGEPEHYDTHIVVTIEGSDGHPWCGCEPCVVREVMRVIWPAAAAAEAAMVVEHLLREADREDVSGAYRNAAAEYAKQVAALQHRDVTE